MKIEDNKKDKKGASYQMVVIEIIIALVGFGVVLFVYSQLASGDIVTKETCHQSVLYRGTLPTSYGLKNFALLKCATEKVCVGEKCNEFETTKGITKVKVEKVADVEKLVSQQIVDCWNMMGKGGVSIFSPWVAKTYSLGNIYPSCVICSRIAFDENLKLKDGKLEDANILKYMLTHKVPNQDVSYYEYLANEKGEFSIKDGVLQIPEQKQVTQEDLKNILGGLNVDEKTDPTTANNVAEAQIAVAKNNLETGTLEKNPEAAILFMQISAPGHTSSLLYIARDLAIGGAAGHFMSFGITTKVMKFIVTKNPVVMILAAVTGVGIQYYSVFSNQNIAAGKCGDISTGDEARNGCSVVRVVNYDVEDIKQYCSVIESIP